MSDTWTAIPAAEVRPGDRIRLASGQELLVTRIETSFLGMDGMLAFIEDTQARWFKQPVPQGAEVEVSRAA